MCGIVCAIVKRFDSNHYTALVIHAYDAYREYLAKKTWEKVSELFKTICVFDFIIQAKKFSKKNNTDCQNRTTRNEERKEKGSFCCDKTFDAANQYTAL